MRCEHPLLYTTHRFYGALSLSEARFGVLWFAVVVLFVQMCCQACIEIGALDLMPGIEYALMITICLLQQRLMCLQVHQEEMRLLYLGTVEHTLQGSAALRLD